MQANKLKLAAAAVAAISALAVWGVMQHGASRTALHAKPPAYAAHAPAAAPAQGSWFSAVGGPPAGEAGPAATVPLARQVDQLVAAGKPEDLYRAYNLIDDCMTFQRLGTLPFLHFPEQRDMTAAEKAGEALVCASLTELHRRARIDYLAAAAKAGVPGADTAFMVAGPFGDRDALATRPDDPLVVEWRRQALAQLTSQALQGDLGSLNTLWTGHLSGWIAIPRDPVLAYTYHAALQRIDHDQNPDVADGPYSGNMFAFLKDGLTPEQLAAANAKADRIALNFHQRMAAQEAKQ
ncbi:hypothetical protein ASD15_17165 [Massilia sp. Root351]|jgi:hypothetical protein|uniref:hypothetical protein n=1 Tax=Massilia sp. Root351 TaxID=1736522 RepID=UPI00070AC8C6|nr:hypothetical protein [Massilia sp. Root351]KQV79765.1 hypothetical protein ASD15_17165 [Massilia sp. Root351]